jgi:hypothetical protein
MFQLFRYMSEYEEEKYPTRDTRRLFIIPPTYSKEIPSDLEFGLIFVLMVPLHYQPSRAFPGPVMDHAATVYQKSALLLTARRINILDCQAILEVSDGAVTNSPVGPRASAHLRGVKFRTENSTAVEPVTDLCGGSSTLQSLLSLIKLPGVPNRDLSQDLIRLMMACLDRRYLRL